MARYIAIADAGDIAEGKVISVATDYGDIAITRLEGQVYAFEDVCTHDGACISTGKTEGCVIICPRHQAKFDMRTGEVLAFPATSPIIVYPVRINGNMVEIEVEDA